MQRPDAADSHRLKLGELYRRLGCGPTGLSEGEAGNRLARLGPNRLPERPPRPAWAVFFDQFRNLLTLMLIAAGLLAGLVGDLTDMAVVLAVTLFNACLGFIQERRAGKLLDALRGMLAQKARVRRAEGEAVIAAERLVPGDLVILKAGDRVPADGRIAVAGDLEADEAALTGESLPVEKDSAALDRDDVPLAERSCMLFMNSVITRGRAEMVVTATGPATEMGKVALLLQSAEEEPTPLQRRLDQLGRRLALIAGLVVALVLAQGLLAGLPWAHMLLTAVALAVAAIPEGLPAVVTVTMALGMARMAAKGAVVRRMAAVETLGSTAVICSDKTGTLTEGRMSVVALWALDRRHDVEPDDRPEGLEAVLRPAALCTEARLDAEGRVVGDPTESALLSLALRAGVTAGGRRRRTELPFSSERKWMAVLDQGEDGAAALWVKGAPDRVLDLCSAVLGADGPRPLDDGERRVLAAALDEMADHGLRVVALAGRPADPDEELNETLGGLMLTGLAGLADPPRAGAARSIAECRAAGIAVKMITGDHRRTAAAIARSLGLEGGTVDGVELDAMDDAELARRVEGIAVFARVTPEHKVRIVRALKSRGLVTAMTGDGVNDAAALRNADIGVAMGRTGSDVTREAAAMVLTGDDFTTIVRAVREGRVIADNIVKFVRFQLATNIGALLTVMAAPLLGLPLPFTPVQILWVNIIMDGPPAMALAFDPPRRGLMSRPPISRDASILPLRRLGRLLGMGGLMAAATLAAPFLAGGDWHSPWAGSLAFTTFVLFQVFNVFNARVGGESILKGGMEPNPKLFAALAGIVALQAAAIHWPPLQTLFGTVDLSAQQWAIAVGLGVSVLLLEEGRKLAKRAVQPSERDRMS